MKTNLLCVLREPALRASFRYGRTMAGRLHVGTSDMDCVRYAASRLKFSRGLPHRERGARRALYLGVISGLRSERRLMAAFNL